MTIKTIGVAEAKKRLSELLGRVAYGGEAFVIARRGHPIARLGPLAEAPMHLAEVKGWLRDDDPLFPVVDAIVAARSKHRPRMTARRMTRKKTSRRRSRFSSTPVWQLARLLSMSAGIVLTARGC